MTYNSHENFKSTGLRTARSKLSRLTHRPNQIEKFNH